MINLLEYLAAQGMIAPDGDCWALTATLGAVSTASPETLRQVIEGQLARLSLEERSALEAASVCGDRLFGRCCCRGHRRRRRSRGSVSRFTGTPRAVRLALELVELPSGWSPRYQFVHSLHQETLYRLLPPARRLRLHLRIAESLEQRYGAAADQVAGALAEHFEQARDYRRAITYLRMAAVNETRRFANREAAGWLDRALELVERLPPEERDTAPHRHPQATSVACAAAWATCADPAPPFLRRPQPPVNPGNPIATVEALLLAAECADRGSTARRVSRRRRTRSGSHPRIHPDIVRLRSAAIRPTGICCGGRGRRQTRRIAKPR
jgi:hypothetical protein